jgi:hypothetical protein
MRSYLGIVPFGNIFQTHIRQEERCPSFAQLSSNCGFLTFYSVTCEEEKQYCLTEVDRIYIPSVVDNVPHVILSVNILMEIFDIYDIYLF